MLQVENFLKNIHITPSASQPKPVSMTVSERKYLDHLIDSVKASLSFMQESLEKEDIPSFYESLSNLKFFIEYSDELNKNWHIIRAYSGALARINNNASLKNASTVARYYELKYGGRRILRSENWFEHQRWDFLDELQTVNTAPALQKFIDKRTKKLNESFQIFKSELLIFLQSI